MAETYLDLRVEHRESGDTWDVGIDMGDVYVWERVNKRDRIMSDLDRPSAQDVYELAHAASRRLGKFDGSLDDFTASHVVDMVDTGEKDEPGPTRPGRSTGSRSTSRSRQASPRKPG